MTVKNLFHTTEYVGVCDITQI